LTECVKKHKDAHRRGGGRRGININLKKKLVNKNAIKVKTQNSYPLQNFPESLDPTPQNFC